MSKIVDMKPDPMKRIIERQNTPKPPPLGESTQQTNWEYHLEQRHKPKTFSKVHSLGINPGTGKEDKEILMSKLNPGQEFILVKEEFCGHYFIWILCLDEKTGRIIYRANSGDIDFVDWDVPEKDTKASSRTK